MNRDYSKLEQQTIALAGVAQAARLVDQLSRTGSYPVEFLESSIHSLFEFDADNIGAIYGGLAGVKLGLNNLSAILASRQADENSEIVRYVLNMLHLERKFSASTDMMSVVHSRLEHTSFKAEHFSGRQHHFHCFVQTNNQLYSCFTIANYVSAKIFFKVRILYGHNCARDFLALLGHCDGAFRRHRHPSSGAFICVRYFRV